MTWTALIGYFTHSLFSAAVAVARCKQGIAKAFTGLLLSELTRRTSSRTWVSVDEVVLLGRSRIAGRWRSNRKKWQEATHQEEKADHVGGV